jgi:hypothetical protein
LIQLADFDRPNLTIALSLWPSQSLQFLPSNHRAKKCYST